MSKTTHQLNAFAFLLFGVAMLAAAFAPGCSRRSSLPETSPEADRLRWVERADVLADFKEHVEREHDMRFLSVYGLGFESEFPGLPESTETHELVDRYHSRALDSTDDIIRSWDQERLMHQITVYASRYNNMLLGYLKCEREKR